MTLPDRKGTLGQASSRLSPAFSQLTEGANVNKTELIEGLADATGMTKADSQRAVDALFDAESGLIAAAMKRNQKVQITGFGTFEPRQRKERMGRNPRTGEQIRIAASTSVSFRAGKSLKDAVS